MAPKSRHVINFFDWLWRNYMNWMKALLDSESSASYIIGKLMTCVLMLFDVWSVLIVGFGILGLKTYSKVSLNATFQVSFFKNFNHGELDHSRFPTIGGLCDLVVVWSGFDPTLFSAWFHNFSFVLHLIRKLTIG